jgi:hypothetical protein
MDITQFLKQPREAAFDAVVRDAVAVLAGIAQARRGSGAGSDNAFIL